MKILLVGNYIYDGSVSMQAFSSVIYNELKKHGAHVKIIAPRPLLGKLKASSYGVGKWLGYIDRYVIFPFQLGREVKKADIIHFCDQGSALYISPKWKIATIVTCHDVLAIRGAMGEVPDCAASRFGEILQNKIRNGLKIATKIACVSEATKEDAERILDRKQGILLLRNGLNYDFTVLPEAEINRRLAGVIDDDLRYILHVGSNQPRKNRKTVLKVMAEVKQSTSLHLIIAGYTLSDELMAMAKSLKIEDRLVQIFRPPVQILEALYNRADALIFPSRYEGFGWPLIEAQACGCPVIASNIKPFYEVLNNTAILCAHDDFESMARNLREIYLDHAIKKKLVQAGLKNVEDHYSKSTMIRRYIRLYEENL
ncbi:glycosyltransferase family 4 protein [Telmatobacter bradus]|uniref:glycosyltransferase family 4 protein n=1 Tax=Telmatobacter bradus TaxID=474953 RepID=UPI003B42C839